MEDQPLQEENQTQYPPWRMPSRIRRFLKRGFATRKGCKVKFNLYIRPTEQPDNTIKIRGLQMKRLCEEEDNFRLYEILLGNPLQLPEVQIMHVIVIYFEDFLWTVYNE